MYKLLYNLYNMKTITSTKVKQSLWWILKSINNEPIKITRRNRNHAVILWCNEYDYLKKLEEYEDILFWLASKEAIKNWMASKKDSKDLLDSIK
jgi:PHD/YefM family antitoxin component YafN of YafNO toxin-antitoxin module